MFDLESIPLKQTRGIIKTSTVYPLVVLAVVSLVSCGHYVFLIVSIVSLYAWKFSSVATRFRTRLMVCHCTPTQNGKNCILIAKGYGIVCYAILTCDRLMMAREAYRE